MADTNDLARHAKTLGDPSKFFVHDNGVTKFVVEHETGQPRYTLEDGNLVPFEKAASAPPEEGAAIAAQPGHFSGSVVVTNPSQKARRAK